MLWLVVILAALATASSVAADDPVMPIGSGQESVLKIGDVSYNLPFGLPSREEILQALPAKDRPKSTRIECELLLYQLNAPRVYPGVGRARLAQVHFRCVVSADGRDEVVYIDRDHLIVEQ
jgi:hypothetical protein